MPKNVTPRRQNRHRAAKPLPYLPRRHLLSPGERRFFRFGLQPAVGKRFLIAIKPRLADIITTKHFESGHGNKIAMKHLDFVIVTPKTTKIVAAIELNDGTHKEKERKDRDAFVAEALSIGDPRIKNALLRLEEGATPSMVLVYKGARVAGTRS